MILVAVALLAFGVGDLVAHLCAGRRHLAVATGMAAAVAGGLAALSGASWLVAVGAAAGAGVLVAGWRCGSAAALNRREHEGKRWARRRRRLAAGMLVAMGVVLCLAIGMSGSAGHVSGPLDCWYSGLDTPVARRVPLEQFMVGLGVVVFLVASANQIVRLVLETAGTPAWKGEDTFKGGRFLGPLERLLIAAMVLGGDLTGGVIVIAAKGLLRLSEMRSDKGLGPNSDAVEYLLIGTFTSLVVAGGLAGLVLASG